MRARLAGLLIGIVFGAVLSWSGMTAPDVIRGALLLEHAYLFLFFASAVLVATAGSWALRRLRFAAITTREPVGRTPERPAPRHVVGSLLFGVGWGIADACPGPIATQIGQGVAWSLWTLAGVVIGVTVYLLGQRPETEPATDTPSRRHLGPLRAARG